MKVLLGIGVLFVAALAYQGFKFTHRGDDWKQRHHCIENKDGSMDCEGRHFASSKVPD